jgi:glycosyltransferase involved in cell wall biosynthesis
MKQVIFVGWVRTGKPPVDGETTKNQYIIAELKKYCKVTVLDFYQKNRHPWIYLQALWAFITLSKATIILSTSAKNVYGMLRLFKALHFHREIIYWVVGGAFGKHVQLGRFRADVFNYVKFNLVQCHGMIDELRSAGVTNSKFVSNFKPIAYYPDLEKALLQRKQSTKTRFVFLSRIMAEKGCDYILAATKLLNDKGYANSYTIDFYGKVDAGYKETFERGVETFGNIRYHGLSNLKRKDGYDELATYHAMLFPTYWKGEGFAGVFIDAFIAGIPVLASDWAHNAEAIKNGELGIIYPVHDVKALADTMEKCIIGEYDLEEMAVHARNEASRYDAVQVLNEDYLQSIGLIER